MKYPVSAMKMSVKGINLLKDYEQFRALPYDDQTGDPITENCEGATIGYGFLISAPNLYNKYKRGITEAEASMIIFQ